MKRIAGLLCGIVLLSGCRDDRIIAEPIGEGAPEGLAASRDGLTDEANRDLAALQRVTARFHTFQTAKDSGWSTPITGCMADLVAGGMGFHYGNAKLIDGAVRADEPELLLYEPEENGRMRLVAVEFIVPLGAWTAPDPPRLFGREFRVNQAFGIWALHAWAWKSNPSGLFADWNPRVTCDSATEVSTMAHRS